MTRSRDEIVVPRATLLSNGRYRVLLTESGAGMSAWEDVALTRWTEDGTREPDGFACFVHDLDRQRAWSVAQYPMAEASTIYRARNAPGRVQIVRTEFDIESQLD